ncbi:hypothetical protein MD484_g7956, partial [Candolleomyces efflorescens]
MKFITTTAFTLVVALTTLGARSFVSASPDPRSLELEVRGGEFLDYAVQDVFERSLAKDLETRELEVRPLVHSPPKHWRKHDLSSTQDALVNYLYARAARRAAQHALSGFGDTAVTSLLGHAHQAATQTRPRTGGISRSRSRSTYVPYPSPRRAQIDWVEEESMLQELLAGHSLREVGVGLAPNQFQKDAARAAAQKGANAIIAKQKAMANRK